MPAPPPRFTVRGRFRNTLYAWLTMSDRLEKLNTKRPDLTILTALEVLSLDALRVAIISKLSEKLG